MNPRDLFRLPLGHRRSWTTYGDVAALIGTHQVPLGNRRATTPTLNAYRGLRADGRIAADFRWTDPTCTDNPQGLLKAEGVKFNDSGRANPAQRLTLEDPAHLMGADAERIVAPSGPPTAEPMKTAETA